MNLQEIVTKRTGKAISQCSYKEISACVDANDEISKTNPPAYQLFIKSQLFMLFYILFNKCSSRNVQKKDYKSLEKMKLILKFVEKNK
jgi:hypothetical protein